MFSYKICDDNNNKTDIREYPSKDGFMVYVMCKTCADNPILKNLRFRPISLDEFKSKLNTYNTNPRGKKTW